MNSPTKLAILQQKGNPLTEDVMSDLLEKVTSKTMHFSLAELLARPGTGLQAFYVPGTGSRPPIKAGVWV